MATVRETTLELLREQGMTTVFGNPGSTELPMLADFPDDFSYVLGLHETVAVGMADGFAQASGRTTMVNLHTAPGVGNGMGAIFNAQANKAPLVDWSRLGFILADQPKLERNFVVSGVERRAFDDKWEQPWGERRFVRDHGNEMRVRFTETDHARSLVVVFRVFDDGVGFRYEFPDQASLREVNIVDELTEFAIAEPAMAWWIPGGEWNRDEYLYRKTPLVEVPLAHTPITMKLASGVHIAIHEAAVVDYSTFWLRRVDGQTYAKR